MLRTYFTQFARTEELNTRIFDRNLSSIPLRQPVTFYPSNTQHTLPVAKLNGNHPVIENNYEGIYITGNDSKNIYKLYAENIDTDSELRNINKTQVRDSNIHDKYIPSSTSDLYLSDYNTDSTREIYVTTGGKKTNDSNNFFFNHTRQQLKDT